LYLDEVRKRFKLCKNIILSSTMKLKSKLILVATIWDIFLTWVITRALDYFVRRIIKKVRFEVDGQFLVRFLRAVNRWIVDFYIITYLDDIKMVEFLIRSQFFSDFFARAILSSHRRMHRDKILKEESCRSCQIITKNKDFLRKFFSDPKLYPPFKFSKQCGKTLAIAE